MISPLDISLTLSHMHTHLIERSVRRAPVEVEQRLAKVLSDRARRLDRHDLAHALYEWEWKRVKVGE